MNSPPELSTHTEQLLPGSLPAPGKAPWSVKGELFCGRTHQYLSALWVGSGAAAARALLDRCKSFDPISWLLPRVRWEKENGKPG